MTTLYFASNYDSELEASVEELRDEGIQDFSRVADPMGLCETCFSVETDDPSGLIEDMQSELILRVSDFVAEDVREDRMKLNGSLSSQQLRCELW
mgnify:CR=1 FL=1|tara:strand:+ start:249 stop:533 length:285 start_codon:yes stop_codon:yes gene_type:complete